jgi:hypothetical protein
MKSSTEKRKAFVDAFQESLGEMGFFVKNSVFYKYSKANKYLLYVNVEIAGAGTLLRINIGWGSNFAPIKCQRKMIYGAYELDVLRYLERNDAKVRGDIGQFVLKNDLPTFRDCAEYLVSPTIEYFGPLLSDITSLSDYLKTEEVLSDRFFLHYEGVKGGIQETTLLGYLALDDLENASRIADKLVEFQQNRIKIFRLPAEEDSFYGNRKKYVSFEESIQYATKKLEEANQLKKKIEAGVMDDLMAEIVLRDARSIETCTQYFGERKYSRS